MKKNRAGYLLFAVTFLSACQLIQRCGLNVQSFSPGPKSSSGTGAVVARELNLFCWSNFLGEERLKKFEQETGIKVNLSQYSSNEEMLAKLQSGASGYDVAVPSDYIIPQMIKLRLLAELDKDTISPIRENIEERYLKQSYDPENQYTLPYSWTTTGVAYNVERVLLGISSWSDFFGNEQLKGKTSLLDDPRETLGLALRMTGASINQVDKESLSKAKDYLLKHRNLVGMFTSEPMDPLLNGEILAAHIYSSDGLQAQERSQGRIRFVLPHEGTIFAIDNLVILKNAKHKAEAYEFFKYILTAEANAETVKSRWVGAVVKGAKERLPLELTKNTALFPSQDYYSKMEVLQELSLEAMDDLDRTWTEYKMAEK